jgi:hypothetical protein
MQKLISKLIAIKNNRRGQVLLDRPKTELIDFAFPKFDVESFADLGGVWRVEGGYTFYALERYHIERAFLVDTNFTDTVTQRKSSFPTLQLIEGNFGEEAVAQRIGSVDVVIFFDTLLHQVRPDWDEVLEMYASRAKCFLILNQQFTASEKTVRLLDLGEEEYFKNVPHSRHDEPYKTVFQSPYEMHGQHKRINRDIHNIWQWGITDDDLIAKMELLGFKLQFLKNAGKFAYLKNFESHAFVFTS